MLKVKPKVNIPSSGARDKRKGPQKKDLNKKLIQKASNINASLIYAERELWSPQCSLWKRYRVARPRLPQAEDGQTRWVDLPKNSPMNFGGFVGTHNKEYLDALDMWVSQFEETKNLDDVMTIAGPPGSGKSASARIFVERLVDSMNLSVHQVNKWRMVINASQYANELGGLWGKLSRFLEPPIERFIVTKYRLVVIDNFASIPPSYQQGLKAITTANAGKVKYLFICEDPKECMTGFFLSKATILKTKRIAERDALRVVLSLCSNNNIGYELDGIKLAFDQYPDYNLSAIIDLIQEVFVNAHYVSKENVVKVRGLHLPPPEIPPSTAMQPYTRCKICTLVPPCKHITEESLNEQGVRRRKELPRYKIGDGKGVAGVRGDRESMICPEFLRYGRCSIFNRHGRCSLDHPKHLHTLSAPLKRCPQCTIPWPCGHCAYSDQRIRLQTLIEEIRARIGRLRQINIPDPPLFYTRHLDPLNPRWRERVRFIDEKFVNAVTSAVMKEVELWFAEAYSINALAYSNRCKLLLETFGELCTSPLVDPALGQGGYVPPPPPPLPNKRDSVDMGGRKPPLAVEITADTGNTTKAPGSPSNKSLSSLGSAGSGSVRSNNAYPPPPMTPSSPSRRAMGSVPASPAHRSNSVGSFTPLTSSGKMIAAEGGVLGLSSPSNRSRAGISMLS